MVENATRSCIRFMPSGIEEAFRAALAQSAEPWFPSIAEPMTATTWQAIARHGFIMSNYGTHRWLQNDPTAERLELATLDLGNSLKCRIEELPVPSRVRYEAFGLVFPRSVTTEANLSAVQSALSLIALVPSLHGTVAAYLRTLHVLQAPGIDFDVSHSDPKVPFSIFVSIPSGEREGKLRLAESIIHECMHLQLTMIEDELPLVCDRNALVFSPWQQTVRPLGGVLHGLYVFSVIGTYFRALGQSCSLTQDERAFVTKRRDEITQEVAQVAHLATAKELTDEGRVLVCYFLRCLGI